MRPRCAAVVVAAFGSLTLACDLRGAATTLWERDSGACREDLIAEPWPVATPAEAGLAEGPLVELAEGAARGELGNLHALLVVREGRLVFERYFAGRDAAWGRPLGEVGFDADTLHDLRSVTKSVVGALVGIAQGEGLLPSLEEPLTELLPSYRDRVAPEVQRIGLRHALTMSAGFAWDELSRPYWWPWNDETAMWRSSDPVGFALSRPVVAEPGAAFAYNGGLPTLLAAIVERASGISIDRFAAERLFCPLGVSSFEWMRHGSGLHIAASGLRLRPRDMARIGWMMLEGGRFGGHQVVPEAYARRSLTPQLEAGSPIAPAYGYQWWVTRPVTPEGPVDVPTAIGNGGQRIFLLPAARLVVVVTAGDYDAKDQGEGPRRVMAAVLAAASEPFGRGPLLGR